jgi:curved DNA-binding protein CbpA
MEPAEILRIKEMSAARAKGSYYDVLGVTITATQAQIEDAYHDIVRKWHPDRFYSRDAAEHALAIEENFVSATRAFRVLKDPAKRLAYHREIGLDAKPAPTPPPPVRPPTVWVDPTTVDISATSPGGTPVYTTGRASPPPKPEPPPPPPPPKPPRAPTAVDRMRAQIGEQMARARAYFQAGKEDFEAGRYAKAESALYLAVKFDPRAQEYADLLAKAVIKAREGKAAGFIAQAEQEESYQRLREAMALYQKAVECDPPEGRAYFRLGQLQRAVDDDTHGALANFRKAAAKEPKNAQFRLAVAELYEALNMAANARREAQLALDADPRSEPARALLKRLKG